LEIPGQYATCPGQPHPEVHPKLLGFEPQVDVFYRQHVFQRCAVFVCVCLVYGGSGGCGGACVGLGGQWAAPR
jgi:hypothetical protein